MSYEQAFDALKDGDFITAVPLIEEAARENGYTSDVINHAYTRALYRRYTRTDRAGQGRLTSKSPTVC